ncbi:hypothetical protein J4424_03560 [Candidatus Woesearchaeota archaeon]|nr:hypothetical protein [Candidatus Woesearchaeota archaeon]
MSKKIKKEKLTQNCEGIWEEILNGEKILSDVEAEEILQEIQRIRKGVSHMIPSYLSILRYE